MNASMHFIHHQQMEKVHDVEALAATQSQQIHVHNRIAMPITADILADAIAEAIFANHISTKGSRSVERNLEGTELEGGNGDLETAPTGKLPTSPAEIKKELFGDILEDHDWQEETVRGRLTSSQAWARENVWKDSAPELTELERPGPSHTYPLRKSSPMNPNQGLRRGITFPHTESPTNSPIKLPARTPGSPALKVWSSTSADDNENLQAHLSLNASCAARGGQWTWISEHHPEHGESRHSGDATLNVSTYLRHTRSDATLRKETYNLRTSGRGGEGRKSPLVNEWGAITAVGEYEDEDEKGVKRAGRAAPNTRMVNLIGRCETPTLRGSPVKKTKKQGLLKRTLMKTMGRKLGQKLID